MAMNGRHIYSNSNVEIAFTHRIADADPSLEPDFFHSDYFRHGFLDLWLILINSPLEDLRFGRYKYG